MAGAAVLLVGASGVAQLDIEVGNLRSERGVLRICLTADPANFPSCADDSRAVTRTVSAAARLVHFDALPLGDYAVAVIHDENRNAKLDTMLGIPREGFGFSRNPPMGFGPPRFAAARFHFESDSRQVIRLRYLL